MKINLQLQCTTSIFYKKQGHAEEQSDLSTSVIVSPESRGRGRGRGRGWRNKVSTIIENYAELIQKGKMMSIEVCPYQSIDRCIAHEHH